MQTINIGNGRTTNNNNSGVAVDRVDAIVKTHERQAAAETRRRSGVENAVNRLTATTIAVFKNSPSASVYIRNVPLRAVGFALEASGGAGIETTARGRYLMPLHYLKPVMVYADRAQKTLRFVTGSIDVVGGYPTLSFKRVDSVDRNDGLRDEIFPTETRLLMANMELSIVAEAARLVPEFAPLQRGLTAIKAPEGAVRRGERWMSLDEAPDASQMFPSLQLGWETDPANGDTPVGADFIAAIVGKYGELPAGLAARVRHWVDTGAVVTSPIDGRIKESVTAPDGLTTIEIVGGNNRRATVVSPAACLLQPKRVVRAGEPIAGIPDGETLADIDPLTLASIWADQVGYAVESAFYLPWDSIAVGGGDPWYGGADRHLYDMNPTELGLVSRFDTFAAPFEEDREWIRGTRIVLK